MVQKLKIRLKNQKGFTLIELLAVIVILGIIAAIAIPSINNIIQKSRVDSVKSDAIAVYNAAKLYASQHEGDNQFSGDDMMGKTTSTDSVLDHTSLTGITVDVQSDGSLQLTAKGTAGSIEFDLTKATYADLTTDANWRKSPTAGKVAIP